MFSFSFTHFGMEIKNTHTNKNPVMVTMVQSTDTSRFMHKIFNNQIINYLC